MKKQEFIDEIQAFLQRTGMSARTLSVKATGDAGYISRLLRGADTKISTIEKVQKTMRDHDESASQKR